MSLQRCARFAAAALLLLALSVLVGNYRFPLNFRLALIAMFALSAMRPFDGLLTALLAGPFASSIAELMGSPPFRGYESVMLAFLSGWLIHRPPAAAAALRRIVPPATIMIAIVAASVGSLVLQLRAADPAVYLRMRGEVRDGYLWTADITGIIEGANLVVGILLLLAVAELTGRSSGRVFAVIRAMAIVAAVSTGLSVLLAAGVGTPAAVARQDAFGKVRYSALIADVNAAGSYFVLLLGLAGGMAASTTGARQRWWIGAVVAVLGGLGLSGSRSALIAAIAVVALAGAWLVVVRGRQLRAAVPPVAWAMLALLGVIVLVIFVQSPLLAGSDMRRDFTIASYRMIEARPIFGIGMGRYYHVSRLVLPPWLAALYGQENAHDYFLQTAAELGIVGLGVLAWLFVRALRPAVTVLRDRSRDHVTAGLLAGAAAYLITCATGHPLLLQESGYPFWVVLALALVTAVRSETAPVVGSPFRRAVGPAVAIILILASIPFRLDPPRVRLHEDQDGFGPWLADREGRRYRESGEYSSLFVGPDVTALQLPIRRIPGLQGQDAPRLTVIDQEPGWTMHRTVASDSWAMVDITLPGADPLMPYQRINISVFDGEGSPKDPKASGVAIGEVNITAIRE